MFCRDATLVPRWNGNEHFHMQQNYIYTVGTCIYMYMYVYIIIPTMYIICLWCMLTCPVKDKRFQELKYLIRVIFTHNIQVKVT